MSAVDITLFFFYLFVSVAALSDGGRPNFSMHPKIIGGTNSSQGEVPYQMLLLENGKFSCGGSLVIVNQQQVVLTAAHCVDDGEAANFTVAAGVANRLNNSGHEQFPFNLNRYVRPIDLPRQGQNTTGDVCASGWGRTSSSNHTQAEILQTVQIPVVDDDTCRQAVSRTIWKIFDSHICAGLINDGGKGPCHGDSGGPLRSVNGNYLAGIASFVVNHRCVPPGYPVVNTEVSHFIDWLSVNVPTINSPVNVRTIPTTSTEQTLVTTANHATPRPPKLIKLKLRFLKKISKLVSTFRWILGCSKCHIYTGYHVVY